MSTRPPRRTTIGLRIFVGYGVIMALGMFFLLIVVSMLFTENARQVDALEQRQRLETTIRDLQLALEKESDGVRGYLLSDGLPQYLVPYQEAAIQHQTALEQLGALVSTPVEEEALQTVRRLYGAFLSGAESQIRLYQMQGKQAGISRWQTEGRASKEALEEAIDNFARMRRNSIEQAIASSDQSRLLVYLMTLLMFLVAGISVLLSGRRLTRSLTQPVDHLVEVATAFSQGRLDRRAQVQTQDELSMLGRVMNDMAAKLALSRAAVQISLQQTEQRNRQLASLNSIAETLSQSLDLRLILGRTLDHVLGLANLYTGWVWLLDGGFLEPEPLVTRNLPRQRLMALHDAGERARLVAIAQRREVVIDTLTSATDGDEIAAQGSRHRLLIPLATRDRTLGLMSLSGGAERRFQLAEVELFQAIGRQIAVGIENARLFAAEQRLTREALGLADTARLVSGSLRVEEILPIIVQSSVTMLNVDRCLIFIFGDEQQLRSAIYQSGLSDEQVALLEERTDQLQAMAEHYNETQSSLTIPDTRQEERAERREMLNLIGARSALAVGLQARGRTLGVLYLDTVTRTREFTGQDQRVAVAIGDQASVAIENALLYTSVQERASQLAGLYEIGKVISATLDPEELYDVLYRETRRLMDADAFTVTLLNESEAVQQRVFQMDGGRRYPPETVAYSAGLTGYVARSRRALLASRDELERMGVAFSRFGDSERAVQSILCVPLAREERVLGVLSTQSYRPQAYTRQHLELFEAIANQAAIAIENTGLQRRALTLAVIEERNRLARELHDSVTQMLFSITLTLQASRVLLQRNPAQVEQQMEKAQQTAQEALAEMRSLIHQLRPASMRERGLVAALSGYLDGYRARTGLDVSFQHSGECLLSEAQEQALFRIAQEALNNIVKHAAARQVEVRLTSDATAVTLSVRDDGRGLTAERPANAPPAWGLTGMRERAELLGGSLTIESESGRGTRVQAQLPLTESQLVTVRGREEEQAWRP